MEEQRALLPVKVPLASIGQKAWWGPRAGLDMTAKRRVLVESGIEFQSTICTEISLPTFNYTCV
jgi:hypothetical protein